VERAASDASHGTTVARYSMLMVGSRQYLFAVALNTSPPDRARHAGFEIRRGPTAGPYTLLVHLGSLRPAEWDHCRKISLSRNSPQKLPFVVLSRCSNFDDLQT